MMGGSVLLAAAITPPISARRGMDCAEETDRGEAADEKRLDDGLGRLMGREEEVDDARLRRDEPPRSTMSLRLRMLRLSWNRLDPPGRNSFVEDESCRGDMGWRRRSRVVSE